MDPWHMWVIAALILFIIEIATPFFAFICLSIGAVGAAITAAIAPHSITWQIIIFAVLSFIMLVAVRPLLLKYFRKKGSHTKTNVDAVVGRIGIVTEDIKDSTVGGRVKIDGDDWKAVSDDDSFIPVGQKVEILSVNSIILTVKKK